MIRDLIQSIVSWYRFGLFTPLHLLPNKTVVIEFRCVCACVIRMYEYAYVCMHPHKQMHCDFSFDRCFHELNIYSAFAHTWQLQLAFFFFPFVFTIPKSVEIATIIIGSSIIIIIIMLHASVLLSPVYFICAKRILILSACFLLSLAWHALLHLTDTRRANTILYFSLIAVVHVRMRKGAHALA